VPKNEALWGGLAGSYHMTWPVATLYAAFYLHRSGYGSLAQVIHDGAV